MDSNQICELIEKCEEKLKTVIRDSAQSYVTGKNHADWEHIDSGFGGYYVIRKNTDSSYVDLAWVCEAYKWQDLGNVIASYSTEFFNLSQIALLMAYAITTLENRE